MATDAQNAANLRSAERLIAIQLGIDNQGGTWRASLSYDQRVRYENALATYIVTHPAAFADRTLATARWVSQHGHTPLEDTSFDFGNFTSGLADNAAAAAESVAGVGEGVLTVARSASWAIPLTVAVLVGIFLYGQFRKQAA